MQKHTEGKINIFTPFCTSLSIVEPETLSNWPFFNNRVFLNYTKLLALLTNKFSKNKLPPAETEPKISCNVLDAFLIVLTWRVVVSLNINTFAKSCSIGSRNDLSPKVGVLDSAMFLCRHNQVQTSFRCYYVVINEVTLLDFVSFHLGRFFLHLARWKYSRIKDAQWNETKFSQKISHLTDVWLAQ